MTMTEEQRLMLEAVAVWLEIRTKSGFVFEQPISAVEFLSQANSSALLPRLLGGDQPLPDPPPKSFGQPWYAIVEDGTVAKVLVEELDGDLARQYPDRILINRFPWLVREHAETDSYLVSWKDDGPVYWLARIKGDESPMGWSLSRL